MNSNHVKLLEFANSFANQSRKILKKNYLKKFRVEEKKDGTHVTNIDKEIEILFREKLKRKYPSHGIIGEEFGNEKDTSSHVWVIDPLDGTHNFIVGKPLFGTLISCLVNGVPQVGVIDIPILNQRWYGGIDLGVKLNTKKCRLQNKKKEFNELIVSSTSFFMFEESHQNKIKEIYKKARFPIFGTDCYSYGLLLSGKLDLIIEANMKPWDYLAQVALINELGGFITDWKGQKLGLTSDGKVLASIDKIHHKNVLKYLSNVI